MTRRTALATAGALTIVLLAAAAAVATNLGLLQVTTGTGQVGRLSPADLAPAGEVQQATPPGTAATSGDSGAEQGSASGDEPGGAPASSTLGHDDGRAGHDDGRTHERFEGRQDDD
jgi:hypothetical protein